MDAAELFAANLEVIERTARIVGRRARLGPADAEDFVSAARLCVIDDDYAVLRGYQGRSSLATYLAVVFQRLLADERMRHGGRWRSSREAERMGAAGILLETLVRRDQRSLDEAVPMVQAVHPALARRELEAMATHLPARLPPPRAVAIDESLAATLAASEGADARTRSADTRSLLRRTGQVVRATLAKFSTEDRMLIRCHFAAAMTVADISRMLRLPQRPLYRRLESLLGRLRAALLAAGLDAAALREAIGTAGCEVDLGLGSVENQDDWQSKSGDRLQAVEEPR